MVTSEPLRGTRFPRSKKRLGTEIALARPANKYSQQLGGELGSQAVKASGNYYASLFDLAPLGYIILTSKGIIRDINLRGGATLRSSGRKQLIGTSFGSYLRKGDTEKFSAHLQRCQEVSGPVTIELALKSRSNAMRHAELTTLVAPDNSPVRGLFLTMISEVSLFVAERKLLQQSEEKYRGIVENALQGIFQSTPSGRFITGNRSLARLFGYESMEELMSKVENIERQLYVDPSCRSKFKRLIEEQHVVEGFETQLYRKNGTKIWVSVAARLVRNSRGKMIYYEGSVVDITERRNVEDKLKHSREQLRSLARRLQWVRDEERTRIAREMHDQLGQVLTAMKMDLTLLQQNLEHIHLPLQRDQILAEISSMSKAVETTLQSVKRIVTELRPEVLDAYGLLAAIDWQARELQRRSGLNLKLSLPTETISIDRDCATGLFRLFQETLSNVVRHAKATSLEVNLKKQAGHLVLEIVDDGVGIREEDVVSVESVGLIGMRERAALLDGEVTIFGTEGKGTTVRVSVPCGKFKTRSAGD